MNKPRQVLSNQCGSGAALHFGNPIPFGWPKYSVLIFSHWASFGYWCIGVSSYLSLSSLNVSSYFIFVLVTVLHIFNQNPFGGGGESFFHLHNYCHFKL